MNAATPPRFWASAMTCWQTVVLPDDSGPKISVTRPRGMPPTPRAMSRDIDPVGIASTAMLDDSPNRMMEPSPHRFVISSRACSRACFFSSAIDGPMCVWEFTLFTFGKQCKRRKVVFGQPWRHTRPLQPNVPRFTVRIYLLPPSKSGTIQCESIPSRRASIGPGGASMFDLRKEALEYHHLNNKPGKISVTPTKPLDTQRDLGLAYTPGVAEPVLEIEKDPATAYLYTSKGNLVAVISNGTAILGLGDRGPLASKPVMEGKGVLFKKFADIDVFDIEVNSHDVEEIIRIVKAIAPTFGGINLEDIKAPECFTIEQALEEMLDIPVFHDDQHGTAIISGAGLLNALEIVGKDISKIKIVISGAGASAISCARMAVLLGAKNENVILVDSKGVVYEGRTEGMNKYKQEFV